MVISDGADYYATEVKPYKNNKETLLRMIAEIMTYTDGYKEGVYKKPLHFFEKNCDDGSVTSQQREYDEKELETSELIKKADITVFRFEITGENEFRICRL